MSTHKTFVNNALRMFNSLHLPSRADLAYGLIENAGTADEVFDSMPGLWAEVRSRFSGDAVQSEGAPGLDFQRTFRRLIDFQTSPRQERRQASAYLQMLFHQLGKEWVERELLGVPLDPIPVGSAAEVKDWFARVIDSHPAPRHPLYDYIEREATEEDFRYFVRQERTVDAVFADLLALLQLGPLPWKQEVARNYWDEMGEGEGQREHAWMFRRVLERMGVAGVGGDDDLLAESLACGNLLFWLCASRPHGLMGIGALAATEFAVPARFTKVVNAVRRLNLPPEVEVYYSTHVEGDEDHAEGWLNKVICPALHASRAGALEISQGVYLRLNTSQRYCDALLSRMRGGRVLPGVPSPAPGVGRRGDA
jgi:hypothetical protein